MFRSVLLGALLGVSLCGCYYYDSPGYYPPAVYAAPAPYYYSGFYSPFYFGSYYGPRYYGGYRHYYYGGYHGYNYGGGGRYYHGHH